ncbi:MAG TPA: ABC transporter permease [Puia sp.]|jgi:putative ABC transport system permease protein|nr:ABC transporter permease [Puia sp.]
MLKNYFKIAFRNLLRHKLFSGLNIFGLATGMACSILIFLWVQDELSFDSFNPGADRIFRVTAKIADQEAAVVPPSLAYAIKTQIPAIKNATRISSEQRIVTIGTKKFDEKKIYYADSNFLQMFNYPLLTGNPAAVLTSPVNAVITEATAIKYFGDAAGVVGKTIYIENTIKGTSLTVAGVLKNIPANSHLQFDILLPMALYDKIKNPTGAWSNFDVYVYFQLADPVKPTASVLRNIEKQATDILMKNNAQLPASLFAQPLSDIHLHSHFLLDVPGQGSFQYVKIFSLAAIFILVIACINFMNLATAISGQRAKEVGLRKTVGALRPQLIAQFIGESLLHSFVSLMLALMIVYIMLPLFNQLANKSISFDLLNIKTLLSLLCIATFTGLISGSYPAFFLSSINPVKALKGVKILHNQKSFLRNGLVVLQFAISVILIISTLIIYNQLQYIQNRNIGFDKENLLYMKMPDVGNLKNNEDAMRAMLAQHPEMKHFTFTDELPTNLTSGSQLTWRGMDPGTLVSACRLRVDENFAKTFGMKISAGRFFSKNFGSNDTGYVVNETALRTMNLNVRDALGKIISTSMEGEAPVIGVVKDFNFKPVQQPIEPLVMKSNFVGVGGYVAMRTTPANFQKLISTLQKSFHIVYGDYPFSYGFVNEDLAKLYITEQRMGALFNVFSVLSIVISCLGLFGLATFATQRRIKEIGVRKVLGADEAGIVALLSKDFIKLVAVSLIVAFPVAWWAMNKWLNNFAYRINISWWIFVAAGLGALLIALLTVSFQAIKAAMANPVKSLRTE